MVIPPPPSCVQMRDRFPFPSVPQDGYPPLVVTVQTRDRSPFPSVPQDGCLPPPLPCVQMRDKSPFPSVPQDGYPRVVYGGETGPHSPLMDRIVIPVLCSDERRVPIPCFMTNMVFCELYPKHARGRKQPLKLDVNSGNELCITSFAAMTLSCCKMQYRIWHICQC